MMHAKITLWLVEYIFNWSTSNFGQIQNSIEISLVGGVPGFNVLTHQKKYTSDTTIYVC